MIIIIIIIIVIIIIIIIIKANGKVGLRQFHQQVKCNNSWLLSMGYKSPIFSSEKLTKAILRLPSHLRNEIYKFTKDSNLMDGSINLLVFETWLDDQLKVCWNPPADIVHKQDLANKGKLSLHKLTNRTNTNVLETSKEVPDISLLDFKRNINAIAENTSEKAMPCSCNCQSQTHGWFTTLRLQHPQNRSHLQKKVNGLICKGKL